MKPNEIALLQSVNADEGQVEMLKSTHDTSMQEDTPLSLEEQNYVNDIVRSLGGSTADTVTTQSQYKDFNIRESIRLAEEDALNEMLTNINEIAEGRGDVSLVQAGITNSAAETLLAETEGLPAAPERSLMRNELAYADIEQPQNETIGAQYKKAQVNWAEKGAMLSNLSNMASYNQLQASTGERARYIFNQLLPVDFDERTFDEALKAIGVEEGSVWNPVDNKRKFVSYVSSLYKDTDITPLEFMAIGVHLDRTMQDAGVSADARADLWRSVEDFDPGLETFWTVADVAGLISIPYKAGKGVVTGVKVGVNTADKAYMAFKELAKGALKGTAEQIPLAETTLEVSSKIPLVAQASKKVDKFISRLLKADNMSAATREVAESLGSPGIYKETAFEFGTPSIAKGVENPAEGLSEQAKVVSKKVELAQANMALQKSAKDRNLLTKMKRMTWETFSNKYVDTLKMNKIIGAGSGVATSDIIAAFDKGMLGTKQETGHLVVRVRSRASFPSKLNKEGVDQGRINAIKKAQRLSRQPGVSAYVSEAHGRWAIDLEIDTQAGWGTLFKDVVKEQGELKREEWRGLLSSIFTATSKPTDIGMLDELRNLMASSYRSEMESVLSSVKALSKDERALLDYITDMSVRYEGWYGSGFLKARGVSDKVIKAYNNYRDFNDMEYFVLNEMRRADMQALGMKSISFGGENLRGYGQEVRKLSLDELYEESLNRKIIKDSLSSEQMEDYIPKDVFKKDFEKGYRLIKVTHGPDEATRASAVYYWLNPEQTVINELPEFVMSYVPGGRRFFDRNAGFVKQIQMATNRNNREVIAGLHTFATDRDIVGLTKTTTKIEGVRKAVALENYRQAQNLIDDLGIDSVPFKNVDEFKAWADDMGLDYVHADNALEVVKDGQTLSSYERLRKGKEDLISFDDMYNLQHRSAFQAIDNESKIAKKRRTGKDLYTYNFETATPVDIEQQLRYMVNDMVYNGVMKDFTDFYAERFYRAHKAEMSLPVQGMMPTPSELLLKGNVKKGTYGVAGQRARAAETAQKNYFAIRGIPSILDETVAKNVSGAIRAIGNAVPELLHLSDKAAHGVRVSFENLIKADPLRVMRTLTSHWYLGFFNISQTYKQSASILAVASIEPKAALHASRYVLPFTSALKGADGNVYKAFDKLATKFGDAPENVRVNFDNLINMGAFEHGVSGGMIEKTLTAESRLAKLSMAPFTFGEMMNRTHAYLTAIIAKGYDGVKMNEQQLASVLDYGQKLFLHMDATGLSRIQTGTVGKTLLQFLSYRMRWIETVLFENELTAAQRARLALVNSLLVGTEGMMGVGATMYFSNLFRSTESKEEPLQDDKNEFAKFIQRGLLSYPSEALDVDLAAPFELSLFEMADTIIDIGDLELPSTGAVGSIADGIAKAISTVNYWVADDATYEDFSDLLSMIVEQGGSPSSIKNIWLGWSLYDTGKMFNSKGELTEQDNSKLKAVLKMLGFNSLDVKERSRTYHEYKLAKGDEDSVFNELLPLYNECVDEGSPFKWKLFTTTLQSADLPAELKINILKRLNSQVDKAKVPAAIRELANQIEAGGFYGNNRIIQLKENIYE